MGRDIYRSHPMQKCDFLKKSICILLFLIFLLLFSVVGGAIYMYMSNPGIVGAINHFPWMEASKDATRMYKSIKDYDTRGTLDNATLSVNMVKSKIAQTTKPLKKISDFIDAAWKDREMFDKVNNILMELYKPLKKFQNGQEDAIHLIKNINKQLDNMQSNEVHKLASKIMQIIGGIEILLTPENMKTMRDAANVFTRKLNETDIAILNKVMKETDFSMEKLNSIFKH